MKLNTDKLHTRVIKIIEELEQHMKHIDRSTVSYKFISIYHKKLNKALKECEYSKEKK
jgi:hypothetical protein